MITREERIREFRVRQPERELRRKSEKSRTRAKLFTQEELDHADARATELWKAINGLDVDRPLDTYGR